MNIDGLINKVKCMLDHHDGQLVGRGKVIVTAKRNKPELPIPGDWNIYKCARPQCQETYAESSQ